MTVTPLDRRTLVLNADMQPLCTWPLSIISAKEAVSTLWRERADVVEAWPGEYFNSPSVRMAVPRVIALREFADVYGRPKFCRRSVFLRDRFRCQYCGGRFDTSELTFDHVVPRARGGRTTWENILSCCVRCNTRKRAQDANWSAPKSHPLRPLKAPYQPSAAELIHAGLELLGERDREEWGDWLYWNTELEP